MIVELDKLWPVLLTTIVFVAIGLIVFAIAFLIVVVVTPFSVKKEIEEDQNTALAIIIGAIIIGIVATVVTLLMNWYYKQKHLDLARGMSRPSMDDG